MRTTRSFLGLIMALLPILWIGGLFLYLNNVRYAFFGLLDGALGPTLMGLGTVLIILVFLFVLKFWRAATPPKAGGGSGSDSALEEKSDFDPDAALARYMARRNGEPGAPPPTFGGNRPSQGGFGRKGA
jgi:hypothetical protein